MKEIYNDYIITSDCKLTFDNRFSVSCFIEKIINNNHHKMRFTDNKISLILEVEAEKESINFGKNLIKNRIIGF